MPTKRTKKQKIHARYHYAVSTKNSFSGSLTSPIEPQIKSPVESLYFYDPRLITKDVLRTVVISSVMLGLLSGLYLYWK